MCNQSLKGRDAADGWQLCSDARMLVPTRQNSLMPICMQDVRSCEVENLAHEWLHLCGLHAEQNARVLLAQRVQLVQLRQQRCKATARCVETHPALQVAPQQRFIPLVRVRYLGLKIEANGRLCDRCN